MSATEAGFSQTLQIQPERMPVERSDELVLHIFGRDDTARQTGIQRRVTNSKSEEFPGKKNYKETVRVVLT